jgi:hypothetical protein
MTPVRWSPASSSWTAGQQLVGGVASVLEARFVASFSFARRVDWQKGIVARFVIDRVASR